MTIAIQALLGLITNLIPLLTSTANASLIDSIIQTLSGFLPYVIAEISALYTPVKNIIAALSATPARPVLRSTCCFAGRPVRCLPIARYRPGSP